MNQEWSLDVLYRGYEDPKFDEDMKKFESEVAGMKEKIEAAKKLDPVKGLETCLMVKEEMAALGSRLGEFISLKASVNTSDSRTNDMGARYDRIAANQTAANVAFCKYVASIENLDQVIAQSSLLTEYNYYLTEIKKDAAHMLSDDMEDLKHRLAKIIVAYNRAGEPVTAGDLNAVGAIAALLKDALKPNLIQTLEHTPAIVHGGPFANIAHGCNSLTATRMAMMMPMAQ